MRNIQTNDGGLDMLSVQQIGTELLGDNPGKFYILGGTEFGVKEKYINILKAHYTNNYVESPSVSDVINIMTKRQLIPLQPTLYVIRYDDSFISTLSEKVALTINKTNIIGTIVCLYENQKSITKADKYLPNRTASIDAVSPQFIVKYLHQDFPKLPDRFINISVACSDNYRQAQNICNCMLNADVEQLFRLSDADIAALFGCTDESTELQIKQGTASRNFKYLINVSEKFNDNKDSIIYCMLQTMIELDKLMDNRRQQSDLSDYVKLWTREDIYYMFMNIYGELYKLRSISSYSVDNSLVYLFGLLKFQRIPSPEVMK